MTAIGSVMRSIAECRRDFCLTFCAEAFTLLAMKSLIRSAAAYWRVTYLRYWLVSAAAFAQRLFA